ncbi:MAG TPA: histidine phosphatase family protein [Acidimicrobiales bacterium]|jgi:probable phosphoglycerate mutase|nr:histidine phosphatase family protein [Acidimicrobiales bacterium]
MLILVRHGESTGNADGLLLGRIDAPLTERGLTQAKAAGRSVAGATRLISSPLARARDTAEALGTGLPVEIDDRWIEVDYGEFDGRPLGSVPDEVWTRWRSDPGYRPPGGESLCEAGSRVRSACEDLFATDGEGARGPGAVVVVSHVSPIKAATCWALGLGDEGAWRLYLATGSVTRISWGAEGPVLSRYNETPWSEPG